MIWNKILHALRLKFLPDYANRSRFSGGRSGGSPYPTLVQFIEGPLDGAVLLVENREQFLEMPINSKQIASPKQLLSANVKIRKATSIAIYELFNTPFYSRYVFIKSVSADYRSVSS